MHLYFPNTNKVNTFSSDTSFQLHSSICPCTSVTVIQCCFRLEKARVLNHRNTGIGIILAIFCSIILAILKHSDTTGLLTDTQLNIEE